MEADIAARLISINRDFYTQFGGSFSATRQRIQPGVRRALDRLEGHESILDLGCGNGELARELVKRGHRGPYLGVDFSVPLLQEAESQPTESPVRFIQADLTQLSSVSSQLSAYAPWSWICAFAVLHHIPSAKLRLDLLRTVHGLLKKEGIFILSNWQFLNSEKLRARIQDWSRVGLSTRDLDPGDTLLDWRSGGEGLRYVHHFSEAELNSLANETGFRVRETYTSDGEGGRLGLYQVWGIDLTG